MIKVRYAIRRLKYDSLRWETLPTRYRDSDDLSKGFNKICRENYARLSYNALKAVIMVLVGDNWIEREVLDYREFKGD